MFEDCHPTGAFYAAGGHGRTEQAAIADLVTRYDRRPPPRVRFYDEGYWRNAGHLFVVRIGTGQTPDFTYGVSRPTHDNGWAASVDGTCRPA